MNKTQAIKQYLEAGNSITSMEAFEKFGSTRLGSVIFVLRKRGMNIVGKEVTGKDRYGRRCDYCVYYLAK